MELTSRIKMARFQTIWVQMRKSKPLDESHKTGQTSGTKMAFYSKNRLKRHIVYRKLSELTEPSNGRSQSLASFLQSALQFEQHQSQQS
ncbi:hypothetical protein Hanom_Chr10g00951811 [Helianthus anomalus]